jgi:hypothetical protein
VLVLPNFRPEAEYWRGTPLRIAHPSRWAGLVVLQPKYYRRPASRLLQVRNILEVAGMRSANVRDAFGCGSSDSSVEKQG